MGAKPKATPLRNSYWVLPGKVLAGEHPGGTNREATRERLQRLIEAGVECFIDLTENGELKPYDGELPFSVEYLRKPIRDHSVPSQRVHMLEILDCMHDAVQSGRCVYVHCRAGIGRTGTVIGCFLADRGLEGEEALNQLNRLWQQSERSQNWGSVPETDEQEDFVRKWKPRPGVEGRNVQPPSSATPSTPVGPPAAAIGRPRQPASPGSVADSSGRLASSASAATRPGQPATPPAAAGRPIQLDPSDTPFANLLHQPAPSAPVATRSGQPAASAAATGRPIQSDPADTPFAELLGQPSWPAPNRPSQPGAAATNTAPRPPATTADPRELAAAATGRHRRPIAPPANTPGQPTASANAATSEAPTAAATNSAARPVPATAATNAAASLTPATDNPRDLAASASGRHRRPEALLANSPGKPAAPAPNSPAQSAAATNTAAHPGPAASATTAPAHPATVAAATSTPVHPAPANTVPQPPSAEIDPSEFVASASGRHRRPTGTLADTPAAPVGLNPNQSTAGAPNQASQAAAAPTLRQPTPPPPNSARDHPASPNARAPLSHAPAENDPLLDPEALSAARILRDRFLGALLGLAVGDAVAAATQFRRAGTFTPIGDMLGGGPFDLPRGGWSDDTSMALCLADSLLACDGFDARDQMERYRRWQQEGYLTATGHCVGITASTARAIAMSQWRRQAFSGSHDPTQLDPEPLSRIAAPVLFFFATPGQAIEQATESARTTCQVQTVLDACRGLARALHAALSGQPKAVVLENAAVPAIAGAPRNGNGTTSSALAVLTAAVAAFGATGNFRDAILYAANLGGDSDVIAAVTGQLAGAFYSVNAIPTSWHNGLMQKELITGYADKLLAHAMLGLSA